MKINAKSVKMRKAQKSTGSTIAHHGAKSDGDSRGFRKVGPRRRERKCIDPKAGDSELWKKLGRIALCSLK